MKNLIVNISGKAGSGKDTFAKMLSEEFSTNLSIKCTIMHFADSLKRIASNMTGDDVDNYHNQEFKSMHNNEFNCTNREILIALGNGFRSIQPEYWINLLKKNIKRRQEFNNTQKFNSITLIPDTRFINETFGDYTIRITPIFDGYTISPNNSDPSESDLDNYVFDADILNNGLDGLKVSAEEVAGKLIKMLIYNG